MNKLSGNVKERERERETGEGVEFELNGHEGGGGQKGRGCFFLLG